MALPGLSLRPDSDVFDVRIWLKDWTTFPSTSPESIEVFYRSSDDADDGQPNLRVGVLPGGDYFGFFYGDGVRFAVERRGREVWADWPENYMLEDACTYLIGPVIGFVLRLRGVTCLHASAVAAGEQAIALVGFPGAGKSTTAAAFAHCGFPVIADDVVALAEDGGNFLVPPGYPRVNLWPDSVRALFGSEEALPRITPTWDKRYMALGDNGLGFATKPLPLRAIYLLGAREAALAAPVIEEVAGGDALAGLVANTYVNYLLDREMRSQEFDLLSRVVAGIPIRRVRPPADPSVVFDLCEAIAADARRMMVPIPSSATSRRD
ncbi:MAG: hypothetical protein WAN12_06070 [Candidatus Acidiferrum sp.]